MNGNNIVLRVQLIYGRVAFKVCVGETACMDSESIGAGLVQCSSVLLDIPGFDFLVLAITPSSHLPKISLNI